jgi:hypothetical protein
MDAMREHRSRAHQAETVIGVDIMRRIGKAAQHGGAFAGFSAIWVCISTSRCAASKSPATASCASDEVSAKRGVTA